MLGKLFYWLHILSFTLFLQRSSGHIQTVLVKDRHNETWKCSSHVRQHARQN